ncbi:hypothetical protein [Breoghania sp. JC706]|uniref:hypothetical protein n=1 Tax=Breoghania sp. JC706 TaxID=3117732 RepID=UPI0030091C08
MDDFISDLGRYKFRLGRSTGDRFEEFIALAIHYDLFMCLRFEALANYSQLQLELLTECQKEEIIRLFEERLSIAMATPRILRQ